MRAGDECPRCGGRLRTFHGGIGARLVGLICDDPEKGGCGLFLSPEKVWPDHTLAELEALPTLAQGQTCDLKVDGERERIWLARTGVDDGEPWDHKVTVERSNPAGQWEDAEWWRAA